jgi:hypothetical protein
MKPYARFAQKPKRDLKVNTKHPIKIWQVGLAALATCMTLSVTSKIVTAALEAEGKQMAVVIRAKPSAYTSTEEMARNNHEAYAKKPSLPLQVKTIPGRGGIVFRAQFKLTNPNSFLIINPFIRCTYYGASDTPIGTAVAPIYVNVPANKSVVTDEINMGFMPQQSKIARCDVA